MNGRLCAALLIVSIFQSVYATEVECPEIWGAKNYDGRCLKVMGLMRTYTGAKSSCQTLSFLLPGDWRLPSIDDLVNTGLDRTWIISPPGGDCFASASTAEGKSAKVSCTILNGVVCIQISGDVKSSGEAQQDILLNMDYLPREDNIQQAELISEFYANSQQFDDLVYSSMMKKRKKRQAPNTGKRILTGAQRSKIQSVRTKIGKQPFQSRTHTRRLGSTRRVTSTRNNIASVPGDQGAPADQAPLPVQVPAAGESPAQEGQTTHDRGNKQILGGNRGLFRGGENQEAPGKSKTSKKRGRQGREMCMGGWSRIEDTCVFVAEDTLTWEEAKATCEGFSYKDSQATLVDLKEEGMRTRLLAWLDRIAARTGRPTGSFWASENSLQEAGTDADPLTADGNCVAYMGTDGLKFDLCSQRYQYVCQMKAPIITEDDLVR